MFLSISSTCSLLRRDSLRPQVSYVAALTLLFLAVLNQAASANTLTVALDGSAQFANIQAAITASANGDTVLIADGTYTGPGNVDLDFGGKNITITSQNGAAKTFIDCGGFSSSDGSGDHRGFNLHSNETNAIISGLTIENGYESSGYGGGIDNDNEASGSLAVTNCILSNNTAFNGGAVFNYAASGTITLTNCTLNGNTATEGGAVFNSANNGAITLTNCTVSSNTASDFGGGIYNGNGGSGTVTTVNCAVSGNTAQGGNGGGIYSDNFGSGIISVTGSLFFENAAPGANGGGIANSSEGSGPITVVHCAFTNNTAFVGGGIDNDNEGSNVISVANSTLTGNSASYGGGIYNVNTNTLAVTNCALTGNTASYFGGGIYNNNSGSGPITVTNSTLTGNSGASSEGGGIYVDNSGTGTVTLTNTIVYADSGGELVNASSNTTNAVANYSDIEGNAGTPVMPDANKNFSADPLFVIAPTELHLQANSSCIGAGKRSGAPSADIEGTTRHNPPSIGAYEYPVLLTSSLNPASAGQSVTFTASVTGRNGTPTGTVSFYDGTTLLGSQALDGTGTATFSVSTLTAGSHTISAAYGGDVNNAATTSSTLMQFVSKASTTTTLTSSLNPSVSGQKVIFTAAVAGYNPTGTVTFTDTSTSTPLGTGTLDGNGHTTVNTSTLAVGSHTITAVYGGDINNAPSDNTASPLTQVVQAVTIASMSFNPSTVTGAGNTTGTLTLTGPAPTGNAVVQLTSSNPAALYVPPTAQLNAGLTSRTFTAVSKNVTATTTVTVTATYNGTSATATVTVNPAPVYIGSVSFNPSTVTAGANTTGTLTLTGPAPAGNAVVQLSSSNPAALYVPATAQISAGLTSRTVTAVSKYVNATTTVTVTATYNGTSTTTTVTVNPAPVYIGSVSFNPSSVTGGANTTGTLTLTGPAPSGAAIVHLTSSNPAALYVPPTAQLNAGLTSRTFTAVSKNVTATQTVTVTATYNGTSATATVTINPAPVYIGSVSFNPSTVTAGANTTGTLTLTGPAPAGNAVVQLSSSNPAALYVPATAQINPGITGRTFTAVSKNVTATQTVTVTATYNGTSKTTQVTVTP